MSELKLFTVCLATYIGTDVSGDFAASKEKSSSTCPHMLEIIA